MTRWIGLTIVVVLCANVCQSDQNGVPNLLANPGFEAGAKAPSRWHLGMEGHGAGSAVWSSDHPHSGSRCVRVELTSSGDYYMADQTLPAGTANPGELYRLCGWYRANADRVAHPTVYSESADGKFLGAFEFSLPRADQWTFFDTVFKPKPGADRFRVQLRVQGQPGVVFYDDVTLCDASAAAQAFDALAARLKPEAAKLSGYWRVITPAEGGLQLRLRGRGKLHVAMEIVGTGEVGNDSFAGLEVLGKRIAQVPILGPGLPLGKIVEDTVSFSGLQTVRLVGHDLGPRCALLVAVRADPAVKAAVVDGGTATLYQSPAGEPLPWAPKFVADDANIKALAASNIPDHLRALLGARPGQPAIAVTDSLTKRQPDQWVDDVLSGAVKGGRPVRLLCAGNETESFQCLYVPAENPPGNITARMSPLTSDGGGTIPAKACKISMVGYVPFQGKLWPDPLFDVLPFKKPPATPVLWCDIAVPGHQRPGIYRGKLFVFSGKRSASAIVEVRVPAFSISRETHLHSSFWLFRGQIKQYFGKDPSPEIYDKYIDLATSHRLSPIDVLEGPCSPLVSVYRERNGSLSYDWSRWDEFLKRVMAGGGNTIHLGWTHWMGRYFSDSAPVIAIDRATGKKVKIGAPLGSPQQLKYLGEYIEAAEKHVRSLGFKGLTYVQPFDEPGANGLPGVTKAFEAIGKYAPGVPRLMDACPPNLQGMDVWCPLSPSLPGGYESAKTGGKTIWWYVCCGPRPPYANLFTNQSAIANRMLFLQSWQHHVTGVLYWGLNFWNTWGVKPKKPAFPAGEWTSTTTYEGPGLIGDGYSIYPGPTADHPLSSIRLETMRDGIEDYEYLYLLNQLVEKKGASAEVKGLLAVPPSISKSLTDYTQDPAVYEAYREQVADAIEELSSR